VGVGHAAGTEVAGDTVFALAPDLGALARELLRVASVVELSIFFEAREDDVSEKIAAGAAREEFLHLVDGVGTAREGAEGYVVEVGFGVEFAGLGEHTVKDRSNLLMK